MESATDLYTANLIDYFAGDDEVTSWLERYWLPEELQHGNGLRRYVESAWPDFPGKWCVSALSKSSDRFATRRSSASADLEMASRCVVEMGTASFYTGLSRASPDPVLAVLTRRIAEDEVRHYKHFYRYFRKYRNIERPGRGDVARALWRRLRMTGGEDRLVVLKHVHRARHPHAAFDATVYRQLQGQCRKLLRPHFPIGMSVRMLVKPLALGPRAQRVALDRHRIGPAGRAVARRGAGPGAVKGACGSGTVRRFRPLELGLE